MAKVNPFTFLNDISYDKKNILTSDNIKEYNIFLINRGLSYFPDTIFYAQEMNIRNVEKDQHYQYCINTISKRRRFSKWAKSVSDDTVEAIMELYNYSLDRALEVVSVLSEEQKQTLKGLYENGKGGR